jgi:hypothetical protein
MLALPDVEGTTAVRTDINKNYILSQADASILSNWVQLALLMPVFNLSTDKRELYF